MSPLAETAKKPLSRYRSDLDVFAGLMGDIPWKLVHLRNAGHAWMAPLGHQTPWCVVGTGVAEHAFYTYGETPGDAIREAILHLTADA